MASVELNANDISTMAQWNEAAKKLKRESERQGKDFHAEVWK